MEDRGPQETQRDRTWSQPSSAGRTGGGPPSPRCDAFASEQANVTEIEPLLEEGSADAHRTMPTEGNEISDRDAPAPDDILKALGAIEPYREQMRRLQADFDNYRKRTLVSSGPPPSERAGS